MLKINDVSYKIQNLLPEETERTEVFNAIFSYFYAPFVYRSSFFIVQILFCMNIMPTFMTPFASIWPVVKIFYNSTKVVHSFKNISFLNYLDAPEDELFSFQDFDHIKWNEVPYACLTFFQTRNEILLICPFSFYSCKSCSFKRSGLRQGLIV